MFQNIEKSFDSTDIGKTKDSYFDIEEYEHLVTDFNLSEDDGSPLWILLKRMLDTKSPTERQGPPLLSMSDAARMLGISTNTIKNHEQSGLIKLPVKEKPKIFQGREVYDRLGVPLSQFHILLDHYNLSLKHKMDGKGAICIAITNQKGGVGKSTTTNITAHGLSYYGARVLVIDNDNQSTQTNFFGWINSDFKELFGLSDNDTPPPLLSKIINMGVPTRNSLVDMYEDEYTSPSEVIIKTQWPRVDLVRSNDSLFYKELQYYQRFHSELAESKNSNKNLEEHEKAIMDKYYGRLKRFIDSVRNDYDVILIDSPPSLSIFSLNIMAAADAFIIPSPPRGVDWQSTLKFHQTLAMTLPGVKVEEPLFCKNLFTMYSEIKKEAHVKPANELYEAFKNEKYFFKTRIKSSADIETGYSLLLSPYEYNKTKKQTLDNINSYIREVVETIIQVRGNHGNQ